MSTAYMSLIRMSATKREAPVFILFEVQGLHRPQGT